MFAMAVGERREIGAQTVNVAVVDDDSGVRHALARLLRAAGFNPVGYSSAEGFLADPTRAQTDCLVLDVQLGGGRRPRLAGAAHCTRHCAADHFRHRPRGARGTSTGATGGMRRLLPRTVPIERSQMALASRRRSRERDCVETSTSADRRQVGRAGASAGTSNRSRREPKPSLSSSSLAMRSSPQSGLSVAMRRIS